METGHGPAAQDWLTAGERIDALISAGATGGAAGRERAEELVRLVADLYGAGLERLLTLFHERGHLDAATLDALAGDDLVASLLLVHGLHPYDVATRVQAALEDVRPYLGSHGGDVELLDITDEGVVHLRLLGSCDGCPSSSVTLKLAVEGAIESAAPEVTAITVDDTPQQERAVGVIPVSALRSRLDTLDVDQGSLWQPVPDVAALQPGAVLVLTDVEPPVLACRLGDDLFAYLDRCARCESSLTGAVLARRLGAAVGEAVLRCPTCHAHYDVRRAGACLDDDGLHLTPLPLLTEHGVTSIALPAPVPA